jgi:DNA adenine methylase
MELSDGVLKASVKSIKAKGREVPMVEPLVTVMRHPRPFLKWAGGKSQLLDTYRTVYPHKIATYYEPFLGGGAVFFDLWDRKLIKRAVLNDANSDLMNVWAAVKLEVTALINELESLQKYVKEQTYYYQMRSEFNRLVLPKDFLSNPSVRKAALLIYLNKTCYNGLYRVNGQGEFNVPFGRYKNPQLFSEGNLLSVQDALKDEGKVKLRCVDFESAVKTAKKGDFVYFDPPYQPLSGTSSFTSYTAGGFGTEEQQRLSKLFKRLDAKECSILLSNSHHEQALKPLYRDYFEKGYVRVARASRAINCVGTKRGRIKEFLIMNYSPGVPPLTTYTVS